jgi:uncharacterized membrane protein
LPRQRRSILLQLVTFRAQITPEVPVSKTRIEALSDGVIAVVVTLLVIDLKPEGLGNHPDNMELWRSVRHLYPHFAAYIVTFAITAAFWYQHHALLHAIGRINRAMFWLNTGFLFAVTLLPFSVSVFLRNATAPTAFLCYFGNLGLMAVALTLGWRYARSAGLIMPTADNEMVIRFHRLSRAFVFAAIFGAIAGFFVPVVSGLAYALPFIYLRFRSGAATSVTPVVEPT